MATFITSGTSGNAVVYNTSDSIVQNRYGDYHAYSYSHYRTGRDTFAGDTHRSYHSTGARDPRWEETVGRAEITEVTDSEASGSMARKLWRRFCRALCFC
ncbi:hypothetical protein FIBSPDRAFT_879282 [Athelia psychrophila]|uniref:Uncharacterized protein n=1 Tax=Athelia psychrophila TaxID=1759441 RepID=A0A167U619_9AGAM|nr:hypothetical protein FIBSPDRAFT_879282 [Fibularhizoctonia sp. CBS 109695]